MKTGSSAGFSVQAASFNERGFVIIPSAFPGSDLAALSGALGLRLAARPGSSIEEAVMAAEAQNHRIVYEGAQSMGTAAAAYLLLGRAEFIKTLLAVTGWEQAQMHLMPLYLIIQLPGDQRFDYNWHQDHAYYPWSERMVTLWFPVNRRTSAESGSISVIPGSHRDQGRGSKTHFRHGFFRQIESDVRPDEVAQEEVLEMEVGDCCIMHGDLVHRSVSNRSETPRIAAVVRMVTLPGGAVYDRERFFCVHKS